MFVVVQVTIIVIINIISLKIPTHPAAPSLPLIYRNRKRPSASNISNHQPNSSPTCIRAYIHPVSLPTCIRTYTLTCIRACIHPISSTSTHHTITMPHNSTHHPDNHHDHRHHRPSETRPPPTLYGNLSWWPLPTCHPSAAREKMRKQQKVEFPPIFFLSSQRNEEKSSLSVEQNALHHLFGASGRHFRMSKNPHRNINE